MDTVMNSKLGLPILTLICLVSIGWSHEPLSLEDATARALSKNPQVLKARTAVQIRKEEAGAARTKRWPVLSTSVQAGPILNHASVTFPKGSLGAYGSTGPIPDRDTEIGIPRRIGGLSVS